MSARIVTWLDLYLLVIIGRRQRYPDVPFLHVATFPLAILCEITVCKTLLQTTADGFGTRNQVEWDWESGPSFDVLHVQLGTCELPLDVLMNLEIGFILYVTILKF